MEIETTLEQHIEHLLTLDLGTSITKYIHREMRMTIKNLDKKINKEHPELIEKWDIIKESFLLLNYKAYEVVNKIWGFEASENTIVIETVEFNESMIY